MDPAAFVLSSLPPPPARVLEVGCGAGELARALDAAGYDVVAVDPKAPDGPIFRRTTLADLDDPGPFAVAIARYSLHHIHELDAAVDRIAALLAPGGKLVLEEFGWDRVDEATAAWIAEQQGGTPDAALAEWRAEHAGLHGDERCGARSTAASPSGRSHGGRTCTAASSAPSSRAASATRSRGSEIRAIGFRYVGVSS